MTTIKRGHFFYIRILPTISCEETLLNNITFQLFLLSSYSPPQARAIKAFHDLFTILSYKNEHLHIYNILWHNKTLYATSGFLVIKTFL